MHLDNEFLSMEGFMAERVGIVGTGIIGAGIAHVFAQAGYEVVMADLGQEQLDGAIRRITANLNRGIERGLYDESVKDSTLKNLQTTLLLEDVAKASLIIENIWEEELAKKKLLEQLDNMSSTEAILASNTSTIPITNLATATRRPDKVVGMHFFNPPYAMNLVEVVRGYHTSDETVQAIVRATESLGKKPVVMLDSPGFVVNRMIAPFFNEAAMLLQEGVASKDDIDDCIRMGLNHPMGPFQLMDMIGLDIVLHEISNIFERTGDSKYRPSTLLVRMVTAGQLGRKTGKGWYEY
jgi:3-hydroxybutyryl-CoA dehydrogenase